MNKILLVLNIVLLLAVGALYFLYFQYTKDDRHRIKDANNQLANAFKIAYFDFDTLDNYYEYSKEVRSNLMKLDSENQAKLSKLREDYNAAFKKYNQMPTPPTQLQQSDFEHKIQTMQADYDRTGNQLAEAYQSESIRQIQQVRKQIQQFLKKYCQEKGYAYVFGTKEYDDVVYYKDTIRNITMDIVTKLNQEFRAGQRR